MKIVFDENKNMKGVVEVTATILSSDYDSETHDITYITVEIPKYNNEETFNWKIFIKTQDDFDKLVSYITDKTITDYKELDKMFRNIKNKTIQLEKVLDGSNTYHII